uniref:Uncharacterized protein n=1 Tax=Faecalibaculum rodentium TaxID=1702221 RepID=A0A140DT44_9FIRM|nr:hypothetical protein AALO17_06870 [Faecalibaculum rodentium]
MISSSGQTLFLPCVVNVYNLHLHYTQTMCPMEEETFPFVPFFCRLSSNCGNFAEIRRKICLERLYRRLCKRKRKNRCPNIRHLF